MTNDLNVLIREATKKDIPSIIGFQTEMAFETENIALDNRVLQKGVEHLFNDPAKGKYYVAEESNLVVGCLMTTYEWSDWRDGNVLWIQSVFVDQKFRARGVYRKLYEYIQGMARNDNAVKGIRLYVDRLNEDAQAVYQKLGMNGEHYRVYEWMKK